MPGWVPVEIRRELVGILAILDTLPECKLRGSGASLGSRELWTSNGEPL